MRTLILFRHGKSDWASGQENDHDRPLAPRGRKAAAQMGRYLSALEETPDLVLCSTALRARDTVRRAADAGDWSCSIELTRELYEATPEIVLGRIRQVDDSRQTLLLGGHEPTWSALAGALVGGARIEMPTAAMARIDFDANGWSRIEFGEGVLVWLVNPKLLDR